MSFPGSCGELSENRPEPVFRPEPLIDHTDDLPSTDSEAKSQGGNEAEEEEGVGEN